MLSVERYCFHSKTLSDPLLSQTTQFRKFWATFLIIFGADETMGLKSDAQVDRDTALKIDIYRSK